MSLDILWPTYIDVLIILLDHEQEKNKKNIKSLF